MTEEALRDSGKACTSYDILLADDTPSWLRLVKETFVPAGYKCDFAENLNSALSKLEHRNFRLACVNWKLMDYQYGKALIRRLGSDFPEIPVIVTTGYYPAGPWPEAYEKLGKRIDRLQKRYPNVKKVIMKGSSGESSPEFVDELLDEVERLLETGLGGHLQGMSQQLAKGQVHFGIITIRSDEYLEVLTQLPQTSIVDGNDERRYRMASLSRPQGGEVVVAVTRCVEQGTVEAQKAASDLVKDLDPQWILVVGIAAGVPDSDFSLGDVMVSSRVYDLTIEASKPGGEREYSIKGGVLHPLARRVVQDIPGMLTSELTDWHSRVEMNRPELDLEGIDEHLRGDDEWRSEIKGSLIRHFSESRPPLALPGAIASSDRLVKDPEITASWKKVARHFLAIEMELAGVCRALEKVPVLGIRGISDVVGLKRDEVWTTYACKTAAAFAISLISSGLMPLKSLK